MKRISFIVPAYNEEALIGKCLASIWAEVRRERMLAEVIVVDNLSTDKTVDIAEKYNTRIIRCPIKGLTHARQAGANIAKCSIHAYIDADNIVPEGWLKNINVLEDKRVVAISGPPIFFEESSTTQLLSHLFFLVQRVAHHVIGPSIQGGNFMLKASALKTAGGHSVDIAFFGEDTDLAVRLAQVGKVKIIPKMWIYSSSRRFRSQGMITTAFVYTLNYLWVSFFGKPVTLKHKDFREE